MRLHETYRLVNVDHMTSAEAAHIAMFSIAAPGHVNPSIEVIRELVARGHRVSYAIPASFAGKVAETGATPVVWKSVLPTEDEPDAWGTELIDHLEPFLDDAVQALPQLAAAFEGDEPDLVLHDVTSYPARVLAHRWGVPAISLSPNLVAWEGYEEEVGIPMTAELRASERGKAYYARFRAWLDENGVDEDADRFVGRPRRSIVLIPRALQPHADRVDSSVHTFVGACQGDRSATQGTWERPAGAAGKKVLLVSLGSAFTKQPAFYRACVEAFGDLPGWHVVLQIGRFTDEAELGEVPANVEVHRWVPQLDILRQADAFITLSLIHIPRWSRSRRPSTSSATPTCWSPSGWRGTSRWRRPTPPPCARPSSACSPTRGSPSAPRRSAPGWPPRAAPAGPPTSSRPRCRSATPPRVRP